MFSGHTRIGGGGVVSLVRWVHVRSCPFTSLVLRHGTPLSFVLLLFSACSMARGQEETFTSQVGRRTGPDRDTPSTISIIISSLSMEELRSYCQIHDNIDFEFPDWEQLPVWLCFLVSSLVK